MNPSGMCLCGCGEKTNIIQESCASRGLVAGQPYKYIHGHANRGRRHKFSEEAVENIRAAQLKRFEIPEKHPRWKGGVSYAEGYVWYRAHGHPKANYNGYVKRCVLMIEEAYGDFIPRGWDVHHNDGNKQNDNLENLAIMPHREHARLHLKTYMPRHYRKPQRGLNEPTRQLDS